MTTRPSPPATDDEIRRAWQSVSDEQPPARVDAVILAAARAAADEKPSSVVRAEERERARPWFQRWQPMLAAAGVTGLAFVLLQSLPRESDRSPAQSPFVPSAQSRATPDTTAEPSGPATGSAPPTFKAAPGPSVENAAPVPTASLESALGDQEPPAAAKERADAGSALAGAASEARDAADAKAVEERIARIVELHGRGDREGAAEELRRLRDATDRADERLPGSLQAWARTVQ